VALSVLFIGQGAVVRAAEATGAITSGLVEARNEAFPDQKNQESVPLPKLLGQVIGYALSFVGIVFFLLSVYGGFLWMTARGNGDRAESGKETIIAAAIGVIIIVGSYALTKFVLGSADSTSNLSNPSVSCQIDGDCNEGESCVENKCTVNNSQTNPSPVNCPAYTPSPGELINSPASIHGLCIGKKVGDSCPLTDLSGEYHGDYVCRLVNGQNGQHCDCD
jgi:hypothetical protein